MCLFFLEMPLYAFHQNKLHRDGWYLTNLSRFKVTFIVANCSAAKWLFKGPEAPIYNRVNTLLVKPALQLFRILEDHRPDCWIVEVVTAVGG